MNATSRAILSPVVGAIIALTLIWTIGEDVSLWRAAAMIVVGAGVVFGLNYAWESNPWTDHRITDHEAT